MHCKLRCDRNRNLRVHCNRDTADTSQVAARTSSQGGRTLYVRNRSLRIAAASQLAWRPPSQSACISRQSRCCTANRNAIFITAVASAGLPIHRRLRIDRHRNLRAQCKIGVPMQRKLRCERYRSRIAHALGIRRVTIASVLPIMVGRSTRSVRRR